MTATMTWLIRIRCSVRCPGQAHQAAPSATKLTTLRGWPAVSARARPAAQWSARRAPPRHRWWPDGPGSFTPAGSRGVGVRVVDPGHVAVFPAHSRTSLPASASTWPAPIPQAPAPITAAVPTAPVSVSTPHPHSPPFQQSGATGDDAARRADRSSGRVGGAGGMINHEQRPDVGLVIAVKRLADAKTRLAPCSAEAAETRRARYAPGHHRQRPAPSAHCTPITIVTPDETAAAAARTRRRGVTDPTPSSTPIRSTAPSSRRPPPWPSDPEYRCAAR